MEALSANDAAENNEAFKRIIGEHIALIESCDGYKYYIKDTGNPEMQRKVNFTAYCSQDRNIQQQEVEEAACARYCLRMKTYDCRGVIYGVLDLINYCVHVKIHHNSTDHHSPPSDDEHFDPVMNEQIRDFIRSSAPSIFG